MTEVLPMAEFSDFLKLDIRIGTIIETSAFPEAKKPAIKMIIDFGPLGIKQTSAQLTKRYNPETLAGKQVAAVVNFPTKRIAGFKSEVLVLGGVPDHDDVVLLQPEQFVENGTPIA
jgi:tRNA-binding protein